MSPCVKLLLVSAVLVHAVVAFSPISSISSSSRQQQLLQQPHDVLTPSFVPKSPSTAASVVLLAAPKGFGSKPQKRVKSEAQIKREQERDRYDDIAAQGGQEYRVFVRQFGSDDKSWLPCGSIAVPRASQVSDAIYSNVDALKSAIVRSYPKLAGLEDEFEFGFNLKVYPDDPIEVAVKSGRDAGISVGNWISNLLSPIDASKQAPPPPSNSS